jgi:3D (Asp-Asp-Asp) domain-containing protein
MTNMRFSWRILIAVALLAAGAGCATTPGRRRGADPIPRGYVARTVRMEVTAYCPCGSCCNWRRNWRLRPVIASGPHAGRPKAVGQTASGVMARRGTVAADTSVLPMGTVIHVPGYGYGRVEDRGGDIRGLRLDLYFRSHGDALHWGRRRVDVTVWVPPDWRPPRR